MIIEQSEDYKAPISESLYHISIQVITYHKFLHPRLQKEPSLGLGNS